MELEDALTLANTLVFAKFGVYLNDLQQAMLRASWSWERQSYDQIADQYGYSPTYLKHDVGPKLWKLLSEALGEKVSKTSFRAAIERQGQQQKAVSPAAISAADRTPAVEGELSLSVASRRYDWGDAVDVDFFYGRQPELEQLTTWMMTERCRLVTIVGMGGMGKTSLSVKLAKHLQDQFDRVIWRSLRNAPPLPDILSDWLRILSNEADLDWAVPDSQKSLQLLEYLRSQRCLLVLDNIETLLQPSAAEESVRTTRPKRAGDYREGYESYGELFRQLGETPHQSCLLLTSREKPREVAILEGAALPVRSLQLAGLAAPEGRAILDAKGGLQGSPADWNQLIDRYSGNPLALKIVSTTIQNLFGNSIAEFLQQEAFVFGGIRQLLAEQFERLSDAEKTVMRWLAINRDPILFSELRSDLFPALASQGLIDVLEGLEQRSLIEKRSGYFSLQPVVMEYVTYHLVEQVCDELESWCEADRPTARFAASLLRNHALMKAQAKDYVREAQARFILQPILDRLTQTFVTEEAIDDQFTAILASLKGKTATETGYIAGNLLNLLSLKRPYLKNFDFSHLTIWQAYLQGIWLHHVNFAHCDFKQSVFTETLSVVFSVAISPDSQRLATGDAKGDLRLWQIADGKPLLIGEGHRGWIWSVAFNPVAPTLASCSNDRTIKIWHLETGQCIQTLEGHTGSVWSVAFSPEGTWLASGGDEAIVRLWQPETGELCGALEGHTGQILTVAFAPQGHYLASGSEDQTIRLWDLKTQKCLHTYEGHTDRVWSVAFSPTADQWASGSADQTIRLWSPDGDGQVLYGHTDRVRSVAFSPDGRRLVSSSDDRTVRLWDVESGQCLDVLQGHRNSVFSVAFSADGQTIASGSSDQTARLWAAHSGSCFKLLQGYTNSVFAVAFHPAGNRLASGSTDQIVRLWDVHTGRCLHQLSGHAGWVLGIAFHPQQPILASSSADQTVRLWQVDTGTCLKILRGHTKWVQAVSFSPDGQWLASAGDDQTIRLWDVSSGRCVKVLDGHESWIWSVQFSPQGDRLVSSGEDRTICVWDVATGNCLQRLQGHTSRVQAVTFSPDGRWIASASGDRTVRLWDGEGQCLQTFEGHQNNVWSVAFSPDGRTLASISLDQTIRLWEVRTGKCLKQLTGFVNSIRSSIAACPVQTADSTATPATEWRLANGNHDGSLQLWDAWSDRPSQQLLPDRPYEGMNITHATGLTPAQRIALKALGAQDEDWL